MAKMDMGECMKKHPMLHSLAGLGLGLVLVNFFPSLAGQTALVAGIVLIVAAVAGEFVLGQK